jgi:hypothetical protein
VIGRTIDAGLLQAIYPELAVDDWLVQCATAMVLELRDREWRFAHDRLRASCSDLVPAARRTLHRGPSPRRSRHDPSSADAVTALAYHWREAGKPGREAVHAEQAGRLALRSGACREAVVYLERSLRSARCRTTIPTASAARAAGRRSIERRHRPGGAAFHRGALGRARGAYYRLGDLKRCSEHAEAALRLFGLRVPRRRLAWLGALLGQVALRCAQVIVEVRSDDVERTRRVATEVVHVNARLLESGSPRCGSRRSSGRQCGS